MKMRLFFTIVLLLVALAGLALAWKRRDAVMRLVAATLITGGLLIAHFFGSAIALKLPGIGPVMIGGAASAALGAGVWVIVGNIGIAAAGTAFGFGFWPIFLGFTVVGAFSALAGGFGIQTIHYPALNLPLLLAGTVLLFKSLKRKAQLPDASN